MEITTACREGVFHDICLYRLLVFLLFASDEFLPFEISINEQQAQLSQRDARRAASVEI